MVLVLMRTMMNCRHKNCNGGVCCSRGGCKVCVDGVVAQPFCESEKRKLASELKGLRPKNRYTQKNDDMVGEF